MPQINIKEPILSQPQFCMAADVDMVTANNWVARKVFLPSEIGGRQIKGTRLYSVQKAYEGRIISELVKHHKILPGDAANIAALATKGGFIEHWARALDANRKFVAAVMVVAWSNDCYDAHVVDADKNGWPKFKSIPDARRRFSAHPFLVVPLSKLFVDVRQNCLAMLEEDGSG
jgi:hypothetical protein